MSAVSQCLRPLFRTCLVKLIRQLPKIWLATPVGGLAVAGVLAGLMVSGSTSHGAGSAPGGTPHSSASSLSGVVFTSASSTFTITGSVYSSPTCSGAPALLYPGVTRCEVFSVTNSMTVPITVQTITTTLASTGLPAQCGLSNLTLPKFQAGVSGAAFVVLPGKTATSPGVPISLEDSHSSQNLCAGTTYQFSFSGTATYTDSTSTVLGASPSAPTYGQSVTFTGTVTGDNPNSDTTVPAGTLSFYSCSSATACNPSASTLLGTGAFSGGKATFSTSSLPLGASYVEALYPGSSTDYLASTSGILTVIVGYDTIVSGNQNGSLTVGPGQAVEISSSGKVNGSATVQSGGILYLDGGTVNGGLTVQSGGALSASGGSVNGSVSVSGAKTVSLCAATVSGGLSVTNSTGPVVIGNPTACAGNTIKGGLTLTNNTNGVTVSANNITGGLACSGNAGLTDASTKNTVSGSRSGQCTGNF